MKLLLLLIMALWFFLVAGPAGAVAQLTPVPLQSVQADFVQEKHLKILTHPIISTGTFAFQRPQSLRWEYARPIRSILLMHDGEVKKFVEQDGRLVEDKGMQFGAMQVVLAEISNWLDGRFTENKMFQVARPTDRTILLTPKSQELAGVISRIELTLADQQGNLDGITIFEGPDSYTRMRFSKRVLNRKIPVAVFTVQ
ncbi:outer membrane lipoprotein carrier protein LolA [Desulfopila sp. IMCC35006]|uniref:outer membrane lipoprotein carrier protein LolA n=1 Tax=Desulfopila sp. IMCC35006 TaxID=2569542 RepID=UPI0010AD25BD|nr:outer membrane lipoprotein carrier protein LolA [Desulfopila sp. IMCC35006]TKB28262.1 outer membrane lipoprotein carrier protein LolA [Desulfopila sp. IMCC35006]